MLFPETKQLTISFLLEVNKLSLHAGMCMDINITLEINELDVPQSLPVCTA